MLPLFFQVVLQDSATKAGARLAIPSLATPIGGLIAGVVMSRWGQLLHLVRAGTILMAIGNALVTSFGFEDASWKYIVYIFPANLGQGIVYPSILFTSLASFPHGGAYRRLNASPATSRLTHRRPRSLSLDSLPHPVARHRLGRFDYLCHCANHAQRSLTGRFGRDT